MLMRKILFFIIIFLLFFGIYQEVYSSPNVAPPEVPKIDPNKPMIVHPEDFPELKQEADVIEYIVEYVQDYVASHDWSYVLGNEAQVRVNEIAALLTKYGYDKDFHFIELKEVLHKESRKLAWYELKVIIFYKANPEFSSVNIWKIVYVPVQLPVLPKEEEI